MIQESFKNTIFYDLTFMKILTTLYNNVYHINILYCFTINYNYNYIIFISIEK